MRRKLTPKGLKRKLDAHFRKMIHARDADEPCVSCWKWHEYKEAGHFLDRRKLSTRWHPWNVNGECVHCNRGDDAHLIGYTKTITSRYGEGALESLAKVSRINWKPDREQLERLIMACDDPEDYESEWFAVQREFTNG